MNFRLRPAQYLAAAVLAGAAFTSLAPAQEAMQLDLEFKNSLLRGPPSQEQGRPLRQEPVEVSRRHPRRHRHRKA